MRYWRRIWHKVCFCYSQENVQRPLNYGEEMDLMDTKKQDRQQQPPTSAEDMTQAMIKHVVGIAELSDASAIFVYVDALEEKALPLP